MKNDIKIIEKEIGYVIEIEEKVSMFKMPKLLGQNYKSIFAYFAEKNIKESGDTMPYTRYLDIEWEKQMKRGAIGNIVDAFTKKWHFQVGVPSTKKLDSKERMISNKISNKKYIRTMHYGPYQKVGETYKIMWEFAQDNNLKLENESIEHYLNDPSTVSKDKIETEVLIGIK
ncbi:MAG: GyrI-like domain-containing protein [Candidatus Marinimicrobia bacterium]|nr:GyrI-like domain-containing protein [Candidatus Neomarinimicrobiota bacterium]